MAEQDPAYCTAQPTPGTHLTAPCADCGHATVLHVGVDHCPVCELLDLNTRAREGLASGRVEITVHGKVVTDQYLTGLLERQARRYGNVNAVKAR